MKSCIITIISIVIYSISDNGHHISTFLIHPSNQKTSIKNQLTAITKNLIYNVIHLAHILSTFSIKKAHTPSYCHYQYLPICKEEWQHMYIHRSHLVNIMKDERVSEDVRCPSQWTIRNTKHHHKQLGMIWCQPVPQKSFQSHTHTHTHT